MKNGFLAIALVAAIFSQSVQAMEYRVQDLAVSDAWARASAGMARAGAAYLTVANHGKQVDRLLSVTTPAAKRAEIHTTLMEQGVMKMRPVKAVEVHPGEPVVLRPGAMHVMLMGLTAPLREGDSFPLTLTFEKAGAVELHVVVRAPGSMGGSHGDHAAPMGHRHGS